MQAANLYRQAARLNASLNSPERDSLMASNVAWLVTQAGAGSRIALWAHDVHISAGGDSRRSFNGGAQMGAYLRRWYGDGYRPISLLTWDGAYSADGELHDHRIDRGGGVSGAGEQSRGRAAFPARSGRAARDSSWTCAARWTHRAGNG